MQARKIHLSLGLLAVILALGGCSSKLDPEARWTTARTTAASGSLQPRVYEAHPFALQAYEKVGQPGQPVTIYIEGDGLSWISRGQPSGDPTPLNPLTLSLAALDPGSNVIYLARPCQYVRGPSCEIDYWTGKRYAPEVIDSFNQALDQMKLQFQVPGFHLVGYSGGGGIAAILAGKRSDVLSLRTIAGNVDIGVFTSENDLTPMYGSINPASLAPKAAHIPQIHFVGSDDSLIERSNAQSYIAQQTFGTCARIEMVEGASHKEGWVERWSSLVQHMPACQ